MSEKKRIPKGHESFGVITQTGDDLDRGQKTGTKRIPSSVSRVMTDGERTPASKFKTLMSEDALPLGSSLLLPFPVSVMQGGALEQYVRSYGEYVKEDGKKVWRGVNETCHAFMYASAIVQTGAFLGRSVWVEGMPNPLYPNVYVALLGRSGLSYKSTARGFAVRHAKEVQGWIGDEDPSLQVIHNVATTEGLVHQLRTVEYCSAQRTTETDNGKETETYKKEIEVYGNLPKFEGVRLLISIDEMMTTFAKRRQQSSSGIIATLTELYTMPNEMQNTSKTAEEKAEYPCTSIIACSTQNWFAQGITPSDVLGGFANRWLYFSHEKMPYVDHALPLHEDPLSRWMEHLVSLRETFWGSLQKFTLSDAVRKRKKEIYAEIKDRLWAMDSEILAAAASRHFDHIHKLALIHTLLQTDVGNTVVDIEQWMAAEAVGEYLLVSNEALFGAVTSDADAEMEQKILEMLSRKGNECSTRDLQRSLDSNTWSTKRYNASMDALEKAGVIEIIPQGRKKIVVHVG